MDHGQEFSVSYSHALPVKGLSALAKFSDYRLKNFSRHCKSYGSKLIINTELRGSVIESSNTIIYRFSVVADGFIENKVINEVFDDWSK